MRTAIIALLLTACAGPFNPEPETRPEWEPVQACDDNKIPTRFGCLTPEEASSLACGLSVLAPVREKQEFVDSMCD